MATSTKEMGIRPFIGRIKVDCAALVSFVFDSQLSLYEHQSTVNPNMPLRDLLYISHTIQKLIIHCNLYGRKIVKIPTPRFVVFYNGMEKQPARKVMYLSESFEKAMEEPELELKVTAININADCDDGILRECRDLWEYSQFVAMTRKFASEMPINEAVNLAVDECIRQGILAEFLEQNKSEAIEVSIFEYDQEKHYAALREEGVEDGMALGEARGEMRGEVRGEVRGRADAIIMLLEEHFDLPADLVESIRKQTNTEVLNKWLKLAVKANSLDAFLQESRCIVAGEQSCDG